MDNDAASALSSLWFVTATVCSVPNVWSACGRPWLLLFRVLLFCSLSFSVFCFPRLSRVSTGTSYAVFVLPCYSEQTNQRVLVSPRYDGDLP